METVPHVVLEYDKWSDCALVALTDDAHSAVRGGTDGQGARARHLALPAPNRAALPAHLAPDRPARDGLDGDARHIRRHGGVAGISRA